MTGSIVIAGAGHAAGQLVASLKQRNYTGRIILIGDERYLPYQRPPLSKNFLSGELAAERLYIKPESFYDDAQIELRLQTSIRAIDRCAKTLRTDRGDTIAYDELVLATGARVRRLPVDGAALSGVHYLRNISDVDRIRAELKLHSRVLVVGGGYIGLEVAAVLRQQALNVTVVETASRVMSRVVSPEVSHFYQTEHASRGVILRLSTRVSAFRGEGQVAAVETADGESIAADTVIVGVGVIANTELASEAGLETDNGIVVDDRCRTSDTSIYAIGDCTAHPNAIYDRRIRLESVHNALEQAKTTAANLCGEATRYSQVPWFWSDQFDLKLQIAGLSDGYDDIVIRGNPADRSFACLYFKQRKFIAIDAVNSPRDFIQAKPLIAAQSNLDHSMLADTNVQLKDC